MTLEFRTLISSRGKILALYHLHLPKIIRKSPTVSQLGSGYPQPQTPNPTNPPINTNNLIPQLHPQALELTPHSQSLEPRDFQPPSESSSSSSSSHQPSIELGKSKWFPTTRSGRIFDNTRFGESDSNIEMEEAANIAEEEGPNTYCQAINGHDRELWLAAINEEMDALDRNKTWSVIERPENQKLIDCHWVFKIKRKSDRSVGRYRARLVAKGFTQRPGIDYDETFAPVVRFDPLRLLHALAAHHGWMPQQLDIKATFLYSRLSETIYMRLPEGCRENNKVAKLHKFLYGLKQSPREWYSRLSDFLQTQGYIPTHFDPCVFILTTGQQFLAVYVDDILIYGRAD
jgi:hypothetical protein